MDPFFLPILGPLKVCFSFNSGSVLGLLFLFLGPFGSTALIFLLGEGDFTLIVCEGIFLLGLN